MAVAGQPKRKRGAGKGFEPVPVERERRMAQPFTAL
jgi:hypothetical protein